MFDLTLYAWERPMVSSSRWSTTPTCSSAQPSRDCFAIRDLLAGAVANPDAPISQLPLLDDSERQRVLVEWNSPDAERPGKRSEYPAEIPLQHLIEANAERRSSEVAVTYRDQRFDVRRAQCSRQPARRASGGNAVGPNVLVGVCIERSLD